MDSEQRLDPRRRELHPERLKIAGQEFIRNDVQAKELGISERSVDRGDKLGAPWLMIGNIKYRPVQGFADFLLSRVQTRKPQPRNKQAKKARKRSARP
jgi:hypothetical protein